MFNSRLNKIRYGGANRNGIFLKRYCLAMVTQREVSSQVSDFEENFKRLADALGGNKRVLLSDEDFSAIANLSFRPRLDPKKYWRTLARVFDEMGVRKTTFIVYLRRQDEYVASHWKEKVKDGSTDKSFREYLCRPGIKHELDYKNMLDTIRDSFESPAKIIVRSYNQVDSEPEGIIRDFCEALEIPWDTDYKTPDERINDALSFDVTEVLRTCKYGTKERSSKERQARRKLAKVLSDRHPDPKGTTILSPEETAALMEEYLEGNRKIAEEYFGNKSLFSEEYNEGLIWHPNRLRIAGFRAAFIWPELSNKLYSGSKKIRRTLKKAFGRNDE